MRREYQAAYYTLHREEKRQSSKTYYASHAKERAAYRASNRESLRLWMAQYRVDHPQEVKGGKDRYHKAHYEQDRRRTALYYATHREELRLYHAMYRNTHAEARLVYEARRKATKRGLPNTLTIAQWEAIKVAYGYKCAYCGVRHKVLTKDHVVPLSKGGGTTPDNIVPACLHCNVQKREFAPPTIPPLRLLL